MMSSGSIGLFVVCRDAARHAGLPSTAEVLVNSLPEMVNKVEYIFE